MFVTKRLSPYLALLAITVSIACGNEGTSPDQTQAVTSSTRLYEGARLIAGDGREAIEESALLVDEGRIVAIGNRGDLGLPLGAVRIDLTGKTIMPMLVSLHGHVGYQDELSYAEDNYTRANIIDHLDKYAYYGVGTILSLGTDAGGLALEIRGEQERDLLPGARLLTAGRGLAAPNAGPFSQALRGSAYGVSTKAEARQAVRELAASDVNVVKIWVDDERRIATGEGNGPVNALDAALRDALGDTHPALACLHLTDFKVRVLESDRGTGAVTRVLLDTTDGERTWTTIGVSANIIEASWQALVDSIVYGLLHASV